MLNNLCSILICLLVTFHVSGQKDTTWNNDKWTSLSKGEQVDSLQRSMYAIIKKDSVKAKFYLDKAKAIRNNTNDTMLILQVNFIEGVYYRMTKQYQLAEPLFLEYEAYFVQRNDSLHLQDVYWQLADIYSMQKDYEKGINYLLQSYDHTLTSQEVRYAVISRLRFMYYESGYYNLASDIFLKHVHLFPKNQPPIAQNLHKMHHSDFLINMGSLDSAEVLTRLFLKDSEERGLKTLIHRGHLNLQTIKYLRNEELDETPIRNAERFFDTQPVNYRGYGYSKMYLAKILSDQGKINEANNLMQKAYESVSASKDYRVIKRILDFWLDLLEGGNQTSQLNKVLRYRSANQDSIQSRLEKEKVLELSRKYETEKKEERIKQLNFQAEINQLALKKSNQQRLFSILAALGLLAIALLVFRQFRIKRKSESLLSEKNAIISSALSEKELLLKEIHHRVKNNLQVVSSLLGLQSEYIKDDSALTAINEGRNRVRSMALIHQNLYSEDNLTGIHVKTYLETLIAGLFDTYNINEEKIKLKLDIQDLDLDVDTVVPLGLIANELVSNALKHAFTNQEDGIISVILHEVTDTLHFTISDNGKGMDTTLLNEEMESFGYQMILAFKEKLDAALEVSGDDGMNVKLVIRNYQKHEKNG